MSYSTLVKLLLVKKHFEKLSKDDLIHKNFILPMLKYLHEIHFLKCIYEILHPTREQIDLCAQIPIIDNPSAHMHYD